MPHKEREGQNGTWQGCINPLRQEFSYVSQEGNFRKYRSFEVGSKLLFMQQEGKRKNVKVLFEVFC